MDVLPQCVLLKLHENNKFLSHRPSKGASKNSSRLRFSDHKVELEKADDQVPETEKVESHHLRFEVEKSKSNEELVHIRTCYNNKYWVRKSEDSHEIVAEAHEPEEDQTKWSCTLFKPVLLDVDADADKGANTKKMHLLHAGELNHGYVGINNNSDDENEFHLVKFSNLKDATIFTVINAQSIAILPEYVAFMGPNGKYLMGYPPNQFMIACTGNDVTQPGVAHRITVKNQQQGVISILNLFSNEFWSVDSGSNKYWSVDSDSGCVPAIPAHRNNALGLFGNKYPPVEFVPIKIGNYIAFQGVGNNIFANIIGRVYNTDNCLGIEATTISEDARFQVTEPIYAREIADANWSLEDARIYDRSVVDKFVDSRSNYTDVEQTGSFQVSYKVSQTMTWKQSTTVNIGVKVSWSAGIPFIGKVGAEISLDGSYQVEYGKEKTKEKTVSYTQNISIPPGKKVTLKVVASKAKCDVPFTSKVRDTMFDGSVREYEKTDGLYVGANEFGFNTFITQDHL